MLPSGFRPSAEDLRLREVKKGLFVVTNAYGGKYDFFAPSSLEQKPLRAKKSGEDTSFGSARNANDQ